MTITSPAPSGESEEIGKLIERLYEAADTTPYSSKHIMREAADALASTLNRTEGGEPVAWVPKKQLDQLSEPDLVSIASSLWTGRHHPDLVPLYIRPAPPEAKALDGKGEVVVSVATMRTSAGDDFYVHLRIGEREITPHVYKIKGRAEYDVAEWKWFFGQGPKPDIMAFDTEATPDPHPPEPGAGKIREALDGGEYLVDAAVDVLRMKGVSEDILEPLMKWAGEIRAALAASPEPKPAAPTDEVRRLRELLTPFANDADSWADGVPDDYRPRCTEPGNEYAHPGSETKFTVGDLRRARAALSPVQEGK